MGEGKRKRGGDGMGGKREGREEGTEGILTPVQK